MEWKKDATWYTDLSLKCRKNYLWQMAQLNQKKKKETQFDRTVNKTKNASKRFIYNIQMSKYRFGFAFSLRCVSIL